ncbi:glycerophosphodiester phosphodiesterase family protein [Pedobacter sp. KBS0701]|uniref:glycerophosphodiester phosphodiesterase family protein n=1 Tax=Pedobacter sp. KBS0701 TaxID=2578106 RepID=UPI00110E8AF7|nr:glycerophosphodiester phosphodiesterase family protein [Pedobacter sp. KBS0701]QDW24412.1 glycerophosphodiester phosphodiesterase family protein [Pedobacter sp. KBS0701]
MRLNVNILLITMVLSGFCPTVFAQQALQPLPESKNAFIVIAHRGSHLIKPENTIASIEEAISIGADYVELDLRTTKDGKLVLLHNDQVDQVSNGKGKIKDLDLEEVKKLILKGKDGGLHHIATFQDALKTCKDRINIYLDFKAADVAQAYSEIKKAGMEKEILVYVNSSEQYASWRKNAPKMPLMSTLSRMAVTKEDLLESLKKMPLEAIDNIPSKELLPIIRSMGISIFVDVQNSSETHEDWSAAMKKSIQGMQTDHPQALIEYLEKNMIRNGLKEN